MYYQKKIKLTLIAAENYYNIRKQKLQITDEKKQTGAPVPWPRNLEMRFT